jgi:SagB-type dehydrogenase family enzyme
MSGIGDKFQQETKYDPEKMEGHSLNWHKKPAPFKNYDSPLEVIPLPQPELPGEPDLWNLLQQRRSRRSYNQHGLLSLNDLSSLLWATQGVTTGQGEHLFRTSPSAGALYPVETYLYANNVDPLEAGIYHFRPHRFDLEFLHKGNLARELAAAGLGQNMIMKAQVTFLWSAILERCKWKYRQRAYRYIYLDAGHIGENLYLAGEAMGLSVCSIAAFYDDHVNNLIGLDGVEETIIYMATVGWPGK